MKNKIRTFSFWLLITIIYLLSVIIEASSNWFDMRFGVAFEEVLFTITSPLAGSDVSFLDEAVEFVMPFVYGSLKWIAIPLLGAFALRLFLVQIGVRIRNFKFKFDLYNLYKIVCLVGVFVILIDSIKYGVNIMGIDVYLERKLDSTTIYDEYYVDPNSVAITSNGEERNLIYVYLESMENTYASVEVGGYQDVNYIPKLTEMASTYTSFSDTELLGGARLTSGANWTMAGLLCSTSGVPFSLPVGGNDMSTFENFMPGLTSLGQILEERGYNQMFLCGSDGTFGGRQSYFEQHGNYDVFDYYDAIDKGYIDKDYYVWWGYEDAKLYEVAKSEILEMAGKDEPFNFTMLTVDTHHVDGYICEICGNNYDHQLSNVVECADNQIYDFINWCKEQDFYENTTIIVTGDHFRMDSSLIPEGAERRLYNCYINSAKEPAGATTNRTFTSLDFFPTTLSAMGFDIEGNRLGLGTDLFSGDPTLAEEIGFDYLDTELAKESRFYMKELNKK